MPSITMLLSMAYISEVVTLAAIQRLTAKKEMKIILNHATFPEKSFFC